MGIRRKSILIDWLRLTLSPKGVWCFIPAIVGILFVYWAEDRGHQALILKEYHEIIAIGLMAVATVLFLTRAVCFRMDIDIILAIMSANFLCRELHFTGTDNGVVIVAGLVFIWIFLRKNQIWASIEQAELFRISLSGTAFTYFFSILIARRVFSLDHLGLLPNEANLHVALEEVLENIAHLFLFFSGIVAFFSMNKHHRKHSNY